MCISGARPVDAAEEAAFAAIIDETAWVSYYVNPWRYRLILARMAGSMNLTTKDAAKLLQVSERTLYRWIDQGAVPFCRINGQCRFNRAELLEWATSRRMPVSVEMLKEPEGDPPPRLLGALQAGGIAYRVGGTDKASVLRSVVDVMRLPDEVDREFLYQVLLARETLGSTAIGDGVAIPHVRNPIVLHVARPSITLCFLDHAIDFGALDGGPVDTLFTLISPTVRAHLRMLSMISFAVRDEQFRQVLRAHGSREEVFEHVRRIEQFFPSPAANVEQAKRES